MAIKQMQRRSFVSNGYHRTNGRCNAVIKEKMMDDNTFTCMPAMFAYPLLGKRIYNLNIALWWQQKKFILVLTVLFNRQLQSLDPGADVITLNIAQHSSFITLLGIS